MTLGLPLEILEDEFFVAKLRLKEIKEGPEKQALKIAKHRLSIMIKEARNAQKNRPPIPKTT